VANKSKTKINVLFNNFDNNKEKQTKIQNSKAKKIIEI
jgi:hypothetical protein